MKSKKLAKSAFHTSKSAFRRQNIKSEKIKLKYIRESYLEKSLKQLFLGNFTEDVTLLGTGLQIGAGIFNLDLLMDIRDLTADFCNWEWSWGHLAQTTLDVVGLLPVVGVLKYGDEAFTLAKHGDELALAGGDILKCADDVSEEALKVGKNITPNVRTSENIVETTEEAIKGGKYSSFGEMSFKDGKQYSAWNKLREEGLTFEQAEKIKHIEKGQKPAPETYLSNEYIQNHLQSFKDSGAVKIMPNEPSGTIGGKGGIFVMSGDELDEIIQHANGDILKIEDALGLDPGYLGKNPVIVMMDDSSNVRMPSGNELGAWPEYWEPGGYTSGGIKEAVIDPVPEGEYTYKFLFE